MKRKPSVMQLLLILLLFVQAPAWGAAVPTVTQTIALGKGWNAVYLEVQPQANSAAEVFGNLMNDPGFAVWAWDGKKDAAQFIQDPINEARMDRQEWSALLGGNSPVNNLFAVNANSTYLIKVSADTNLNITGRPTIRHKKWVPDAFNLTGFSFTSSAPSFATFFAPSKSHKNQTIYRLNSSTGGWEIADSLSSMRSGEAFWIYCQSSSDYQGPFFVEASNADGLDFGSGTNMLQLTLTNASKNNKTIAVTKYDGTIAVPMTYRELSGDSFIARGLPTLQATVKAEGTANLTLVVDRRLFSGDGASVLEFTDGQGSLVRVPVTATSNKSNNYPGLWSGVATLNKVTQLTDLEDTKKGVPNAKPDFQLKSGAKASDTPAELNLNLILHQDKNNNVRLLKQAILMYKKGERNPDGTPRTNGRYVVLTKDNLIGNYDGIATRDGVNVGKRLSAPGFDFSLDAASGESNASTFDNTVVNCSGTISSTIICNLVLASTPQETNPTNPFLHRYHPDHDNLDGSYNKFANQENLEVNQVKRSITLSFKAVPNVNPLNPPPGWGVSVLGGDYTETVTGLVKGPIRTEGSFSLFLVSDVDQLNE